MRLFACQSPVQSIELRRELGQGLVLILDGTIQFREVDEHRYHECLAVLPMLYGHPRRIFIGGGGDGLAAARLLRFAEVESIVVCDYDPEMTRLARQQPDLVALSEGSLNDPRVRVVNQDAFAYLEQSDETFDLIVCDFPDPLFEPLARLYSRELYSHAAARLSADGLVAIQTLAVPAVVRIVGASVESVFAHRRFYRIPRHGFTLASPRPLARVHAVPDWTRYLTDDFADALFVHSKEDGAALAVGDAPINQGGDTTVVKEALVDAHGVFAASPMTDADDVWDVEVAGPLVARLGDRWPLLLEGLHESAPLVVLIDRQGPPEWADLVRRLGYEPNGRRTTRAVLPLDDGVVRLAQRIYAAEHDGRLARIEQRLVCPGDDPAIAAAMADRIDGGGDLSLGVERAALDRQTQYELLVATTAAAEIAAVCRRVVALDGEGLETFPIGHCDPDGLATLLLAIVYLYREGIRVITLRGASEAQVVLLSRLGSCIVTDLEVYSIGSMSVSVSSDSSGQQEPISPQ